MTAIKRQVSDAAGLEFHSLPLTLLAWCQEGHVKCQSSPEFLSLKEVEEENQKLVNEIHRENGC